MAVYYKPKTVVANHQINGHDKVADNAPQQLGWCQRLICSYYAYAQRDYRTYSEDKGEFERFHAKLIFP